MNNIWNINIKGGQSNITYQSAGGELFDCGFTPCLDIDGLVEFALQEGAVAGDRIFINEKLYCEVILNKEIDNDLRNYTN